MSRHDTALAISLGRSHEPAGLVRLQRGERLGETFDAKRGRWEVHVGFLVTGVTELPRAGGYGDVAEAAAALAPALEGDQRLAVVVDVSTAGRGSLAPLRERGLRPVPIDLMAGKVGAKAARAAFEVGVGELASTLAVVIGQRDRLKIAPGVNAAALVEQLRVARGERPKGEEARRFELYDALALAVWWSEHRMSSRLHQPPAPRQEIVTRPPTFEEAMKMGRRRGSVLIWAMAEPGDGGAGL